MYRSLNAEKIITTTRALINRISERFPGSNLGKVCEDLYAITEDANARCHWIEKKNYGLRIVIGIIVLVIFSLLVKTILSVKAPGVSLKVTEFVTLLEAGMNAVVLISAAIIFLVTVETRLKRSRALNALHELRSICHVIDMHQLTKDPERVLRSEKNTKSSPKVNLTVFQLTRYLDYCTEMLSIASKIAALYVQKMNDRVIIRAVNDIEILTTGLSRKIWQKIMILQAYKGKKFR